MKKHPSDIELEAYRNRTVSPDQLLAINDHVFECDQCFRKVEPPPEKVQAAYEFWKKYLDAPELLHLDYSEVEGYVDGTLDAEDREYVSHHIEDCEECASEVREIAELKAQIDADAKSHPKSRKRNSLAAFLGIPGNRLALWLAFLVFVSVSVFWVHAQRTNSRVAALEIAIARLEQETNYLRQQIDAIRLKKPASTPLSLKDGNGQVTIDEKGELLGLEMLPAAYRDAVKDALTAGRISIPPRPETTLGQKGASLGGGPQGRSFEALSPAGTAVEDTRPVFQWQRLEGATSYMVFLKDLATGAEIESQATGKTTWTPGNPLIRGHQYAWMVQATIDGQRVRAPAPEKPFPTFRVLDEQQAQEIILARKSWGSSHLLMGVIYAKAGLTRDAEREFGDLVAANPDSSAARTLLASVQVKAAGVRRQ